jgi:hypothetical protein
MTGGEIWQLAEYPVAVFLIKAWRLEAEGIQVGVPGAPLLRFFFRQRQQLVAIAAAAQFLFDPHQVDVEPIPIGGADQAAGDFFLRRIKHETQVFTVVTPSLLGIVIRDASADGAPDGIIYFFNVDDLIYLGHYFLFPFLKIPVQQDLPLICPKRIH